MTDLTPTSRADATTRLSLRIRAAIRPGNHWFPLALFTAALAVGLLVTVLVLSLRPHKSTFFNVQAPADTAQGSALPTPELTGNSALPPPSAPTPGIQTATIAPPAPVAPTPSTQVAINPAFVPSANSPMQAGSAAIADTPVRILQRTQPEYPRDALRNGEQGVVQLRIDVGADGIVDGVQVVGRSGSRSLDRAATDAARDWRFQPATRAGMPVSGTVELPINFTLDGR